VFDKINLEGTVCAKENILVKFVTSPTWKVWGYHHSRNATTKTEKF
jgi:hypothetical protein